MAERTPVETVARLRQALAEGMSVLEAARHVGVTKDALYGARDRGELDLSKASKTTSRHRLGGGSTAVPHWVEKLGLAEDYRDWSRAHGEHHAARVCRQLKAEAARPCL